ncbi:MAG: hypothetical protein HY901_21405 [Deltaproteobacteria bacterium]|nr:hypothetical protein [Deltaproteobacteria bacterium]
MKTTRSRMMAVGMGVALLFTACGSLLRPEPAERLFFALEIKDGDRVVARPHLLGKEGKLLSLRLVEPSRPDLPRLSLELVPERQGDGYRVQLKLALPEHDGVRQGELLVGHGEERPLLLTDPVRPLSVRLLLMRVASPEFEAWMRLAQPTLATS